MGAITDLHSGVPLPDLGQKMAELRPIQHGTLRSRNSLLSRARRLDREGISRAAVNPLRCAVPAPRKPGVAIPGHPRDACVAPLGAAGKTCDAMQSCIAASQG